MRITSHGEYEQKRNGGCFDGINRFGKGVWDYCDWCGWYGWLETYNGSVIPKHRLVEYECEGFEFLRNVYCLRCDDLKEPPWRPNNRDRYHKWLLRNLRPPKLALIDSTNILRLIAEYLAANRP